MEALIVDDQSAVLTALQVLLEIHDIPCRTAGDPATALDIVANEAIGVVIQDMNFRKNETSGDEGVALFRAIHELDPDLPVILMTAFTSLEGAVELIKEGAADYLSKPWDDAKLVVMVKNLLHLREVQLENTRLVARSSRARIELARRYDLCGLVYASDAIHDLVSLAVNVAKADVPVLVMGPNGSGKEKIAEILHANSRRRKKPFVKVNVGALPDNLLEAELFGAEAGAYTGANKARAGRFEAADGGTLFLDEMGNLSAAGQMKLLRVLQSGEFERLGSNATRKVDVRLITATNADLESAIASGEFRQDLFFRLNVIEIALPGLAARREDVLPLARHFLAAFSPDSARPAWKLSPESADLLEAYHWPGNVRELQNKIQRATLVAPSQTIEPSHLGLRIDEVAPTPKAQPRGSMSADEAEELSEVRAALDANNQVISRAAASLGVSRQALYRKMNRLGIAVEKLTRT